MRRSPAGSAVSPNRLKFFAYTASKDGVGTIFSTQFWYGFMLPFAPIAIAEASTIRSTFAYTSFKVLDAAALR